MLCARCGDDFADDLVVAIQGRTLCATCKSEHVADVLSGVERAPAGVQSASVLARVVAFGIDRVLLFAGMFTIYFGLDALLDLANRTGDDPRLLLISYAAAAVVQAALLSSRSSTPGQMMLRIHVVANDGTRLRGLQAWLRTAIDAGAFAAIIYGGMDTFKIPWPYFVPQAIDALPGLFLSRRAMHDLLARTRVVRAT